MKSDGDDTFMVVAVVITVATSILIGYVTGCRKTKQDAVKAGAAHWDCDPKTGSTTFVWGGEQ